ncbi:MAG: CubicO group peptidase (beta-lactamase class C family), partial [Pseudohongiellaceae bacterium]
NQGNYDAYMESIHQALAFQNAIFEVDASGVFMGSSYLYASARDWARIGQLMLNGGTINGARIMTEDWVSRATTPNTSENQRAYGYQWWLNRGNEELRWSDMPADAYSAQGNRQQYLMVIPSLDLVIVRLGWTAGGYPVNEIFSEIIRSY